MSTPVHLMQQLLQNKNNKCPKDANPTTNSKSPANSPTKYSFSLFDEKPTSNEFKVDLTQYDFESGNRNNC